ACRIFERAGVRRRQDLRQRSAARSNRNYSTGFWPSHRLDRSDRTETAHPAILRASASGLEWDCLRRCGPQAVCDRQTLAKGLSNSSEAAATWNSVILMKLNQARRNSTYRILIRPSNSGIATSENTIAPFVSRPGLKSKGQAVEGYQESWNPGSLDEVIPGSELSQVIFEEID